MDAHLGHPSVILGIIKKLLIVVCDTIDVFDGLWIRWHSLIAVHSIRSCVIRSNGIRDAVIAPADEIIQASGKIDGAAQNVLERVIRVNADASCSIRHELHESNGSNAGVSDVDVESALCFHDRRNEERIHLIGAGRIEDGVRNPIVFGRVAIGRRDLIVNRRIIVGSLAFWCGNEKAERGKDANCKKVSEQILHESNLLSLVLSPRIGDFPVVCFLNSCILPYFYVKNATKSTGFWRYRVSGFANRRISLYKLVHH